MKNSCGCRDDEFLVFPRRRSPWAVLLARNGVFLQATQTFLILVNQSSPNSPHAIQWPELSQWFVNGSRCDQKPPTVFSLQSYAGPVASNPCCRVSPQAAHPREIVGPPKVIRSRFVKRWHFRFAKTSTRYCSCLESQVVPGWPDFGEWQILAMTHLTSYN